MSVIRNKVTELLDHLGVLWILEHVRLRKSDDLFVLNYHRVDHRDYMTRTLAPDTLSALPEMFEKQMNYIASRFRVISVEGLIWALEGREEIPRGSIMITFDDGYRSFLTNVFPIVSKLSIPTTLFVATGYLNSPGRLFWWDELYRAVMTAKSQTLRVPELGELCLLDDGSRLDSFHILVDLIKSLPFSQGMDLQGLILEQLDAPQFADQTLLTWDEVRLLAQGNVAIGSHTRWHPILTRVSRERAREEIRGSKSDLERQLGEALPVFAYPNGLKGDFNRAVMDLLREEGFIAAFTNVKGVNVIGETNPLALQRISPGEGTSVSHLRLQLTHFYQLFQHTRFY